MYSRSWSSQKVEGAVKIRNVKQTGPKQMVCVAENHVGGRGLSPLSHAMQIRAKSIDRSGREPKQAAEESRQAHKMILVLLED